MLTEEERKELEHCLSHDYDTIRMVWENEVRHRKLLREIVKLIKEYSDPPEEFE